LHRLARRAARLHRRDARARRALVGDGRLPRRPALPTAAPRRDARAAAVGRRHARQEQLFEGAMRLRYRVLLEKGLKMMDGTVQMAERAGEASGWVARAKVARR